MNDEIPSAAFIIPILNNTIYLAKRANEPHKNKYCAIGGDVEKQTQSRRIQITELSKEQQQKLEISTDYFTKNKLEPTLKAGIRELLEELYFSGKLPTEKIIVEKYISNISKLGSIIDNSSKKDVNCSMYIATLNSNKFKLALDEINSFIPLNEISDVDNIVPITCAALTELRLRLTNPLMKQMDISKMDNYYINFRPYLLNERLRTKLLNQIPENLALYQFKVTDLFCLYEAETKQISLHSRYQ